MGYLWNSDFWQSVLCCLAQYNVSECHRVMITCVFVSNWIVKNLFRFHLHIVCPLRMSEIIKSPPVRHASSESVSSTPSKSSAMSLSSDSSSLTEHEKTDISRVATSKQSPQPTNNLELPSKEELDELSESMDVRSYRKLKSATLNFKYLRRLGKWNDSTYHPTDCCRKRESWGN